VAHILAESPKTALFLTICLEGFGFKNPSALF
jgi:hypothetical protein